jgi:hypothetical protein
MISVLASCDRIICVPFGRRLQVLIYTTVPESWRQLHSLEWPEILALHNDDPIYENH